MRLASLGDILQTTHVLPTLKKAGCEVHFLVSKCCSAPLENHPFIDKLFVIPNWEPRKRFYKNIPSIFKMMILGLRFRYSAFLMFHINRLYPLLFKWCGVPMRVGFFAPKTGPNQNLTHNIAYELGRSVAGNNHEILKILCPDLEPAYNLSFRSREEELRSAREVIKGFSPEKNPIVFSCPGGATNQHFTMLSKRWSAAKYGKVYAGLSAAGYQVVLVGGKTDFDVIREAMGAAGPEARIRSAAGEWNIRLTAAIFSFGSLYLGNDSAPLYLAIACGIPTLGIFGPTSGAHFGVASASSHFIQGHPGECARLTRNPFCHFPTNFDNDPASHCLKPICMESIAAETVLEKSLSILRGER